MEKTIEKLVNGNIKVTIPIRLKYDGCKTVIRQPETEQTELDLEIMSPCKKRSYKVFSTGICWNQARWRPFPNWHRKSNRNVPSSSGH